MGGHVLVKQVFMYLRKAFGLFRPKLKRVSTRAIWTKANLQSNDDPRRLIDLR